MQKGYFYKKKDQSDQLHFSFQSEVPGPSRRIRKNRKKVTELEKLNMLNKLV